MTVCEATIKKSHLEKDLDVEDCEIHEPAYRKGVDVVVVLNVKQSDGAPGAPPLKVGLVSQKLQHIRKKNTFMTFHSKSVTLSNLSRTVHGRTSEGGSGWQIGRAHV